MKKEKVFKISESALRKLLYGACCFEALEQGGVDNWMWYSEAINNYIKSSCVGFDTENLFIDEYIDTIIEILDEETLIDNI